jgi:prepilin-type N-terminal cleavage/methylation domain-containing protein
MRINTSRQSGFTLVEIMIVVAIIGLLAAIAIPNFVKARSTAQKNTCIANMKQIEGAKQQWAMEKGKTNADVPTGTDGGDLFGAALYIKSIPKCPIGNTAYTMTAVNVLTACPNVGTATDHVLP